MTADNESMPVNYIWSVDVAPAEVDAGAEFTIKCQIEIPSDIDPVGLVVSIRDQDNGELATAELTRNDGGVYVTDPIALNAPATVGEYAWRALLVLDEDGARYEVDSTEFSVVVKAHAIRLNVWDVPTAISAGERFAFKTGIKCSSGCDMAGKELSIVDGEGKEVGTGVLRDEVWPGTDALYFAELEAGAPLAAGDYKWEIRFSASGTETPHAPGVLAFPVKVMPPPDCEVTVEVFDTEKQTPISGARVVMHPYRAVTDADGVAKLKAVGGTYKLLVSATRYLARAQTVELTGSMTIRTELALEPVVDATSLYV